MKNKIGIVGGGQLGRMLTDAAHKLGFTVFVLDPTPNSPAGQVADQQIVGSFKDKEKIKILAEQVDFLTFEIELANAEILSKLSNKVKINPSARTLTIIKDKLFQKQFLKKSKIPTADFIEVKTKKDIISAGKRFGYPLMLKARLDAYDGRGNALIKNEKDISRAMHKLKGRLLYLEKYVPFTQELAIMVVRNTKGEIKTYPVVATTHIRNICNTVIIPAQINITIQKSAKKLAKEVMKHLEGAGVFGIEMFLTTDSKILVNEIAPRVHNSGHYTIEACVTSQFEQHIRAITGMPLGSTKMIVKAAAMINILGRSSAKAQLRGLKKVLGVANATLHIYGKSETRIDRKMGHITVVGNTTNEVIQKATKAREMITI